MSNSRTRLAGWQEAASHQALGSAPRTPCVRLGARQACSRWWAPRSGVCALTVILALLLTDLLSACGGGSGGGSQQSAQPTSSGPAPVSSGSSPDPVATISVLYPSCIPAEEQFIDGVDNQLSVIAATDFVVAGAVVRWNGSDRPTTTNGSLNGLTAQISASDIAAVGTAVVTVFNPAPGGGSSNSLTFTITTGAVDPQSIAVDPAGKFAYVMSGGCNGGIGGYVSMYTIDSTTGALASIGPPVWTHDYGFYHGSVTVAPSGKFVYVTNSGDAYDGDDGSVAMYAVNATTGALTFTGTINGNCPGLCFPTSVVVDPSGRFAYVTSGGGSFPFNVEMYTINGTTGALTSIGTIAAGTNPVSVAVDPSGKFVYATNSGNALNADDGSVAMYTINATTGALTAIGTIAAGTNPVSAAMDPSGKFAYVTNSGSNDVSMYTIDATTGTLTLMGTTAAGTDAVSIALDPSGKFAYVTNFGSNNVSMFTINSSTGSLTPIGVIAAGLSPTSIAMNPSGNFAYVTNSGSNNVSMYSIGSTGTLILIGTIGT
jgi:6-phosphogluconolactonase (cycloisomerase 2 family)